MSVRELESYFSDVIERVKAGEKFAVTSGKKKEIIGYFLPEPSRSKTKRKLGILEGKAKVLFKKEFKITEEEFLNP